MGASLDMTGELAIMTTAVARLTANLE